MHAHTHTNTHTGTHTCTQGMLLLPTGMVQRTRTGLHQVEDVNHLGEQFQEKGKLDSQYLLYSYNSRIQETCRDIIPPPPPPAMTSWKADICYNYMYIPAMEGIPYKGITNLSAWQYLLIDQCTCYSVSIMWLPTEGYSVNVSCRHDALPVSEWLKVLRHSPGE